VTISCVIIYAARFNELEVFQENYAMLCNTLKDIDDLLKYFVTEKIITIDEEEKIRTSATKSEKAEKLLLNISGPLQAGNTNGFHIMLKIMKKYGTKVTQDLVEHISSRLK